MENILYIIAGLVLILLIAGLVLRKKKAQAPAAQPHLQSGKKASTLTPKTDRNIAGENDSDDKFDHITIAQRFMDQQRYDKAIETLNRGLIEKPKDNQLSLKLLSIYATINQPESFNKVYDAIKMQNDAESMVLADELKTLFFEEQNPEVAQEALIEEKTNFESIDFDLPTRQADNQHPVSDTPVIDSNSDALINKAVDDSFDLTLSDLESDLNKPDASNTLPVAPLDIANDESIDTTNIDASNVDTSSNVAAVVEDDDVNDLSDFDFSFDLSEENDTLTAAPVVSDSSSSTNEETVLEGEEFILDFDDLATDSNKDTEATIDEALTTDASQHDEDDFALSLDSFDELASESPIFEIDSFEADSFEANNDKFVLEDNNFENIELEEVFNDNELEVSQPEASSAAPTAPLLFDDNTSLDDEFGLDAPTATTPVDVEADIVTEDDFSKQEYVETTEDFSARFAADFDFVKSLDSSQVTLDLASQYIQLGEYDSAKRLLNEVMTQGNSEQQSQAQALLERTA